MLPRFQWSHTYTKPIRQDFPDPPIGALEYWLLQIVIASQRRARDEGSKLK